MHQDIMARIGAIVHIDQPGLYVPADTPVEDWLDLCRHWAKLRDISTWAIGDLIEFGERVYGETYAQVEAELTQSSIAIPASRLMQLAHVSRHWPRELRIYNLGHSFYQDVIHRALPLEARQHLLQRAEREGWTREELRDKKRQLLAALDGEEVIPVPEPWRGYAVVERGRVELHGLPEGWEGRRVRVKIELEVE